MHLSDPVREFVSALAGGIASVTVCHPLDVTRTMMNIMAHSPITNRPNGFYETLKSIYREEGWRGFYKGNSSLTQDTAPPYFQFRCSTASTFQSTATLRNGSRRITLGPRDGRCWVLPSSLAASPTSYPIRFGYLSMRCRSSGQESWCRFSVRNTSAMKRPTHGRS